MSDLNVAEPNSGEGVDHDPVDSEIAEQAQGEIVDLDPDVGSVRSLVRFWLLDTQAKIWNNDEIDGLLYMAGYGGQATDKWATTGDTRLFVRPPMGLCPYPLGDIWGWLNWWDRACTPFYTRTVRYYTLMAAWYGWESAANDASLCARIERTGLFETDTWTTYKAVQARAVAMKALAVGQTSGLVVAASRPVEPLGMIW